MFNVDVKITGKQGLSDMSLAKAIRVWETEVSPAVLTEIRRRSPVSPTENGGRLRDSISVSRRGRAGGIEARFTSSVSYAKFVQDGTEPHVIEPRQALALHWTKNGSSVFASRVNHPGTRPNPFVRQAIQAMLPMMRQKLREHAEEEFRK